MHKIYFFYRKLNCCPSNINHRCLFIFFLVNPGFALGSLKYVMRITLYSYILYLCTSQPPAEPA